MSSPSAQDELKIAKKAKVSAVITSLLKLFYSILFTTGSVFQHSGQEDRLSTICQRCDKWTCNDEDEILDCMKNYRYGFLVGGAIVFLGTIILEVIWVYYKIYIKQPQRIHHIMSGVYALGIILLWIAAVMEIELADMHTNVAPALWIVGGLVTMIAQIYFCKTLSMWFAYTPPIIASLLFVIAKGILGINYIRNGLSVTKVYEYDDFIRYKAARYTAQEYSDLQAKLMISGSVFYIIHALLYFNAVSGKIIDLHESMQTEETSVHRNTPPTKASSFLDLRGQSQSSQ